MELCLRDGCGRRVIARGWCDTHYSSERKKQKTAQKRAAIGPLTCVKCGLPYVPLRYTGRNARCEKCREPIDLGILICAVCGVSYVPQRYHADSARNKFCSRKCKEQERINDGRASADTRRYLMRRKYGITHQQYVEMRESQGNGCAICGRTTPVGRVAKHGSDTWLHVDHDHVTGTVRGLLCHSCNVSIGHFRDDPKLLEAAMSYLSRSLDYTP